MWLWTRYVTFLGLCFLICETEIIMVFAIVWLLTELKETVSAKPLILWLAQNSLSIIWWLLLLFSSLLILLKEEDCFLSRRCANSAFYLWQKIKYMKHQDLLRIYVIHNLIQIISEAYLYIHILDHLLGKLLQTFCFSFNVKSCCIYSKS